MVPKNSHFPAHAARWIVIVLGTAGYSSAATIFDDADPQAYRDLALLYPSVGQVTGSFFNGSGVLISDRWVLTAGHIAFLRTGGTFTIGGMGYTIQSTVTHPDYRYPNNFSDLALLQLASPVTAVTSATMLGLASSQELLGKEATWVGFGLGGDGATGAQGPLDHRAFTNVIDVFGTAYNLTGTAFISDFDRADGSTNATGSSPTATSLEGNVAGGDSGGGVFIKVDGIDYLVGVTSFAGGFSPGTNSRYGSISGANDLQQFHRWIFEQTGVAAVPEPSFAVLGCISTICLLSRRPPRQSKSAE